ncbi:DNA-binding transcriptional LysR family regulator [Scopulibacillus darangshiensis]|uniref:DNA-binding transcriptional LysR family regulator n=1 Tax=Scopulibacillus darangshiensis TaxID=442528 RepID=A0A4R2P7Q9_9BACL|nr:LysR family transcriptional regulator [Scopulibacillus darangshiensis]TCP30847.1 DNA-binding transcriptional LysR family regulator [Scopulibacillus darangshiensis]
MMELRNLKTFQTVAECLSLTKAAKQLGYTQPTITVQIKALEKEIGYPLLTHVGKQTILTPTGKLLKKHTDNIFKVMQEMERDLKNLDHFYGTLVIASPEFYCANYLPFILRSFVERHPQVKIKLESCNSIEALNLVSSDKADVGIIAGASELSEIESTVIDSEDIVLVASPELLKNHDTAYVLENYPFLVDKNVEGMIGSSLSEINYAPRSVIECSSEEAIKRSVLNQMGTCIMGTKPIEDELKSGDLIVLHRFSEKLETSMICFKNRKQETAINALFQLIKDMWGK